jgi:hypothetical protein
MFEFGVLYVSPRISRRSDWQFKPLIAPSEISAGIPVSLVRQAVAEVSIIPSNVTNILICFASIQSIKVEDAIAQSWI